MRNGITAQQAFVAVMFIVSLSTGFLISSSDTAFEISRYNFEDIQIDLGLDSSKTSDVVKLPYREEYRIKSTDKIPVECKPYHPRGGEETTCKYRNSNHIEDVSLISDPFNYVTGNFSTIEFDVTRIRGEGNLKDYREVEFLDSGGYVAAMGKGLFVYFDSKNKVSFRTQLGDHIDEEEIKNNSDVHVKSFVFDPDFKENKYVYVYYYLRKEGVDSSWMSQKNPENYNLRLSRFKFNTSPDKTFSEEKLLLNITGARAHGGGGLEFGPDAKLYFSLGDATRGENAQNFSNYRGKVLRMNSDGSIPEDNPFNDSLIYSYGHRNPQTLSWDPQTGDLYASEHGNMRHDEINMVKPGTNYGWPVYACEEKRLYGEEEYGYKSPETCFKNWTMAPSGSVFVDDKNHPWYGKLFVTGLRGRHVRIFDPINDQLGRGEIFYFSKSPMKNNMTRRFRDIEYFNGSLYVVSDYRGIVRISPSSTNPNYTLPMT